MKKKIILMLLAGTLTFSITGCGNTANTTKTDDTKTEASDEAEPAEKDDTEEPEEVEQIKIEDIDWSVEEGLIDDQSVVEFSYTNNSKYTVLDVEMNFEQKEGTTTDQLAVFDTMKADKEWTDEDVADVYILGYNRKMADPGEKVEDSPCVINGTYTLVENMDQYNIMEPSNVTIAYLGNDNKVYSTYYDFKIQEYSDLSNGGVEAVQWSEGDMAAMIPKPESKVITVDDDDEDEFSFKSYGITEEDFKTYIESCKTNGFTVEPDEDDNSYEATNADGYSVDIRYNEVDEDMSGSIEKAE